MHSPAVLSMCSTDAQRSRADAVRALLCTTDEAVHCRRRWRQERDRHHPHQPRHLYQVSPPAELDVDDQRCSLSADIVPGLTACAHCHTVHK